MDGSVRIWLYDRGDRIHASSVTYKALLVNPPFYPESAFERGFSITLDARGKIIRSVAQVAPGDEIRTKLKDGEIRSSTAPRE
jgi:exonuclease VII large subunit